MVTLDNKKERFFFGEICGDMVSLRISREMFSCFSLGTYYRVFFARYYPSYMRNNEESGVLFSPVICYNINGINNRREIVSPRFQKIQAGVLISRHSPGLDTHVVRRDYFFYCFFVFIVFSLPFSVLLYM